MAYTNAIFYLDYVNGNDAARASLTTCIASNPSGSITRITKAGHGLVTGAVVTTSAFTAWLNGVWKITWVDADNFDLDTAVWQATADNSGTVVPFGGQSWADAWKTITSGATAARIAPGDIIRIAKSPAPSSIGNATWTNVQAAGGFPGTKGIGAMADNGSGAIRLTVASHGYATGDVIQVIGLVTTGTTYEGNGAWIITYNDANTFDLDGSVYVNTRASGGTAQKINSKAVVLASAQTLNIDRCEDLWSNGVDGTASVIQVGTDAKEGTGCCRVIMDASPQANQKQAFRATGTLAGATMNGYQKLSFWIKNEVAIANATTWYVGLCSDTAGATVIDTFPIPAIPSTGRWIPLTIERSGGGNLGGNASTDVKSM
jgi:hypothetical protein